MTPQPTTTYPKFGTALPLNIDALRAATPGCEATAFLSNAGSALSTTATIDAVKRHLDREAQIGGYAAADEAHDIFTAARAGLATLIGGASHEIALTMSDSTAWTKGLWGWALGSNMKRGSVVLIDRLSYHSHIAALTQLAELFGFDLAELASLDDGTVDLNQADRALADPRVTLVCATAIGTHCGNVNPIEQLGAKVAERSIPFFVDGCQALAHIPIDVRASKISLLTGTGRKWLRAPRGTGMLWIDEGIVERFVPPGIDGVSSAWDAHRGFTVHPGMKRFEEFEGPFAALVGMANAVGEAVALGIPNVSARILQLAEQLRTALASRGAVVLDTAERRCGIVTFAVPGVEAPAVVAAAAKRNASIGVSTSGWAALDMNAKGLAQVVRVSPHIYNTEDELSRVIDAVDSFG